MCSLFGCPHTHNGSHHFSSSCFGCTLICIPPDIANGRSTHGLDAAQPCEPVPPKTTTQMLGYTNDNTECGAPMAAICTVDSNRVEPHNGGKSYRDIPRQWFGLLRSQLPCRTQPCTPHTCTLPMHSATQRYPHMDTSTHDSWSILGFPSIPNCVNLFHSPFHFSHPVLVVSQPPIDINVEHRLHTYHTTCL